MWGKGNHKEPKPDYGRSGIRVELASTTSFDPPVVWREATRTLIAFLAFFLHWLPRV